MVWTAAQTAASPDRARRHPLHALYHRVAFTGLRRGEACGLRWSDLDLAAAPLPSAIRSSNSAGPPPRANQVWA
jgi:hypothetical protein